VTSAELHVQQVSAAPALSIAIGLDEAISAHGRHDYPFLAHRSVALTTKESTIHSTGGCLPQLK
jgi:hypothetical protein